MEDVAIAYGFNELPKSFPSKSGTVAKPLPINKLGDILRIEAAMAGWAEVLPLILCSHDENFAWLNRKDDGNTAVKLANPKTAEYQVVRTTLLPGLLKTIRENKHHAVPIKIFEVSDVAFKDLSLERKSRNERHFAAAWYGKTSGFEVVHGLLDRLMTMLRQSFTIGDEGLDTQKHDVAHSTYWIEEVDGKQLLGTFDIKRIRLSLTSSQTQHTSPATPPPSTSNSTARSTSSAPLVSYTLPSSRNSNSSTPSALWS